MYFPKIRLLKFLCLALLPSLAVARDKTPVEQARILARQGDQTATEIVTLLVPEIEAHPENAEAHRLLAEAYALQSEWRWAIEQYDALLALNELKQVWDPEVILLKAEALANSAQHQAVIELLEVNTERFRKTRKHRAEFETRLREARDEVLLHVAIPDLNLARDMGLSSGWIGACSAWDRRIGRDLRRMSTLVPASSWPARRALIVSRSSSLCRSARSRWGPAFSIAMARLNRV